MTLVLARQVTQAFNSTDGCASYLALKKANHYGLCDFVAPSSTHQVLSGANFGALSCMCELHALPSEQHCLLWLLARGWNTSIMLILIS